jgi:hypothetical protein
MSSPPDTAHTARALQLEILRRMDGPTRLAMAMEMSDDARAISEAGIRHRNPQWTDEQVHEALLELLLGRELARKVLHRLFLAGEHAATAAWHAVLQ